MAPEWMVWLVLIAFGAACFALGGSVTYLVLLIQKRVRD